MIMRKWKVALGALAGLIVGSCIGLVGNLPVKEWAPPFVALGFFLFLALAREPERWCLFIFLVIIPLPMHAFLLKLSPLHGGGALGIYLMAADLPMLLLYFYWFLDWARKRNHGERRSNRFIVALLPFLVVSGLSIVYSVRPLWAVCEWLRWIKVLLILIYAAKRLRLRDVSWCLSALAVSVLAESGLAILQSGFQSNLGLDRLGLFGSAATGALTQELATGQVLYRGAALTGHPNFLASYLLILLPVFGLLALVEQQKKVRLLWYLTLLIGLGGLVATMSRAAWISLLIAGAIGFMGAVFLSVIHPKKAVVITMGLLFVIGITALSFSSLIEKRFESDFSASWDLRVKLNHTALAIAGDHPLGGVGLNNYTIVYPDYDPAFAAQLETMDNMITVVHNVYLLILAETGAFGLAAFLAFYFGVFVMTFRLIKRMDRWNKALALGILCGLLGALLFDLSEISLWMEITMYTIAFLVGTLEVIAPGSLRRVEPAFRRAWSRTKMPA